jgi:hypothetical protein
MNQKSITREISEASSSRTWFHQSTSVERAPTGRNSSKTLLFHSIYLSLTQDYILWRTNFLLIASPRSWWKYELGLLALQLLGSDLASSRGVQACIYIPRSATRALRSNRLKERCRCNPRRRWRNILEASDKWTPQGTRWHGGGAGWSHLASSWGPLQCGVF